MSKKGFWKWLKDIFIEPKPSDSSLGLFLKDALDNCVAGKNCNKKAEYICRGKDGNTLPICEEHKTLLEKLQIKQRHRFWSFDKLK